MADHQPPAVATANILYVKGAPNAAVIGDVFVSVHEGGVTLATRHEVPEGEMPGMIGGDVFVSVHEGGVTLATRHEVPEGEMPGMIGGKVMKFNEVRRTEFTHAEWAKVVEAAPARGSAERTLLAQMAAMIIAPIAVQFPADEAERQAQFAEQDVKHAVRLARAILQELDRE